MGACPLKTLKLFHFEPEHVRRNFQKFRLQAAFTFTREVGGSVGGGALTTKYLSISGESLTLKCKTGLYLQKFLEQFDSASTGVRKKKRKIIKIVFFSHKRGKKVFFILKKHYVTRLLLFNSKGTILHCRTYIYLYVYIYIYIHEAP